MTNTCTHATIEPCADPQCTDCAQCRAFDAARECEVCHKMIGEPTRPPLRCNRCHRQMRGSTAYDGACACGGLIEATPCSACGLPLGIACKGAASPFAYTHDVWVCINRACVRCGFAPEPEPVQ